MSMEQAVLLPPALQRRLQHILQCLLPLRGPDSAYIPAGAPADYLSRTSPSDHYVSEPPAKTSHALNLQSCCTTSASTSRSDEKYKGKMDQDEFGEGARAVASGENGGASASSEEGGEEDAGTVAGVVADVLQGSPDSSCHKSRKGVVVVIGAGEATGAAVAKRFAKEGYTACLVRRKKEDLLPLVRQIEQAGGRAVAFGVDARKETEMVRLFERIEQEVGPVEVAVYNIGANVQFGILKTTSRVFFKVWQMACFAGFLTCREAARHMTPRGHGTILVTGATASVRGSAGFAAFASAKFALRGLAQSLARELGPQGIHVAHLVIDAAIDTPWIRQNFPDRAALKDVDGVLRPEDVAEVYWQLHCQPRTAWTHELDLRPWVEKW